MWYVFLFYMYYVGFDPQKQYGSTTETRRTAVRRFAYTQISRSDSVHIFGTDGAENLENYNTVLFYNKTDIPVKFTVNFMI